MLTRILLGASGASLLVAILAGVAFIHVSKSNATLKARLSDYQASIEALERSRKDALEAYKQAENQKRANAQQLADLRKQIETLRAHNETVDRFLSTPVPPELRRLHSEGRLQDPHPTDRPVRPPGLSRPKAGLEDSR